MVPDVPLVSHLANCFRSLASSLAEVDSVSMNPEFSLARFLLRHTAWIHLLLSTILFSIALALRYVHGSEVSIFFTSLTALIPLTALIRLSVEELTLYLQLAPGIWLGHVLGGIVDCVLGYERWQTPHLVQGSNNIQEHARIDLFHGRAETGRNTDRSDGSHWCHLAEFFARARFLLRDGRLARQH